MTSLSVPETPPPGLEQPLRPAPEPSSGTPVADARRLTKIYLMGTNEVRALDGVTLRIDKGEFVAIMGPSGSGKSTLMNVLGCLDTPTSGTFLCDGVDVSSAKPDDLAALRNRKIGFVFQQFHLLPRLTALQNVVLPLLYSTVPKAERTARATQALRVVGLGERMDHLPNQMSGGQQQRVAIARALVNNPEILFADEPTGALDTATGTEILTLFKQLNRQGRTIILVTHEADVAAKADRQITIRDGKIQSDTNRETKPATGGLTRQTT